MKFSLIALAVFLQLVALSVQEAASNKASSVSDGKPARCYVCNENTDERCKDPFKADSNLIQDCSAEEKSCRKITQSVNGKTSVVRQCAKELYKPNYEGCYKTAGKASQTVCTCFNKDDDKPCNQANGKITTSAFALAASIVLSIFLLK